MFTLGVFLALHFAMVCNARCLQCLRYRLINVYFEMSFARSCCYTPSTLDPCGNVNVSHRLCLSVTLGMKCARTSQSIKKQCTL